jgi:hypothetical protein
MASTVEYIVRLPAEWPLSSVSGRDMKPLLHNLPLNPPQKFDIARTVRVFNSSFEFVEFEPIGTALHRKTAPIPGKLMGLAGDERTQKLLRTSFRVIDDSDAICGSHLHRRKQLIARRFIKPVAGYGTVILRAHTQPSWPQAMCVTSIAHRSLLRFARLLQLRTRGRGVALR